MVSDFAKKFLKIFGAVIYRCAEHLSKAIHNHYRKAILAKFFKNFSDKLW